MLFPLLVFAEVYITTDEAIKNIFPHFQEYKTEKYILDNQEFEVYSILKDNEILGWTVKVTEMGKNKPITFLVGIDNLGKVLELYVLEFNDIFGSEIKRRSFLRQFQGKSSKDVLMVGRDIDAVTGATISSQAAASSVKKAIKVIEELYK